MQTELSVAPEWLLAIVLPWRLDGRCCFGAVRTPSYNGQMRAPSLRPYTMDVQPVSEGRAFLARAFSFLCLAEWQHLPAEVEEALRPETRHKAAEELKRDVALAVQTIGGFFLKGHVETYARPFGGGAPMKLPRAAWELDDFVPRFAASALDPRNPFDPSCPPTHWIFVDSEQFDVVLGRAGPTQVITPKAADLV